MIQTIGKKVAELRSNQGWTQQYLAGRIAISRVALSHIESDLSIPGERTITLLAGMFKLTPLDLVDNTSYPEAKRDRLPFSAPWFTPLEKDVLLMENDLKWLGRIKKSKLSESLKDEIITHWDSALKGWESQTYDPYDKASLEEARNRLDRVKFSGRE
jgi:transcriptional regulator with XRE-family HTH domain